MIGVGSALAVSLAQRRAGGGAPPPPPPPAIATESGAHLLAEDGSLLLLE